MLNGFERKKIANLIKTMAAQLDLGEVSYGLSFLFSLCITMLCWDGLILVTGFMFGKIE